MIASFFYHYGANRNVKIFIGSDDSETRKEFSELCGQKKIKSLSVNTTVETSASSNTGAQNQPLITVGMLERLNGDEKGDAIVSVRGYEPIWARFTPSYEMPEVYFPNGKADISKREARFFDKSDYVFDISPDSMDLEDALLEAIERDDENYMSARQAKLQQCDKDWQDIKKVIDKQVTDVAKYLDEPDAVALMQVPLERKVDLLFLLLKRDIDLVIKDKMKRLISDIKEGQKQLKELQEQAKTLQ